jgi:hypothetical protein
MLVKTSLQSIPQLSRSSVKTLALVAVRLRKMTSSHRQAQVPGSAALQMVLVGD